MNIFEYFKERWVKEKLDVHPPKDEHEISKCFERFGVSRSEDILALYGVLDGKDCMDDEHFRLWSIKEILDENSSDRELERTRKYGVLFADYCINSWCYRINSNGNILIDYFSEGLDPELRAGSLSEFFQLMAKDPDEALL